MTKAGAKKKKMNKMLVLHDGTGENMESMEMTLINPGNITQKSGFSPGRSFLSPQMKSQLRLNLDDLTQTNRGTKKQAVKKEKLAIDVKPTTIAAQDEEFKSEKLSEKTISEPNLSGSPIRMGDSFRNAEVNDF